MKAVTSDRGGKERIGDGDRFFGFEHRGQACFIAVVGGLGIRGIYDKYLSDEAHEQI
jgi:hypothetical protein